MRRRTSAPIDSEADTPRDASGTGIGLHLVLGFVALTGAAVLAAAGGSFYAERHTSVQGIVVAHRIVPANTIMMAGQYGPKPMTAPERHVLLVQNDGERAAHTFDVSARFWNEAHDHDHVRREGGVWRIERH